MLFTDANILLVGPRLHEKISNHAIGHFGLTRAEHTFERDNQSRFFLNLARQSRVKCLARIDFSAGKIPHSGMVLRSGRPLQNEISPPTVLHQRFDGKKKWLSTHWELSSGRRS